MPKNSEVEAYMAKNPNATAWDRAAFVTIRKAHEQWEGIKDNPEFAGTYEDILLAAISTSLADVYTNS